MASTSKTSNPNGAATASAAPAPSVQEFNIRVPKKQSKKYHVMRFNANLKVHFSEWRSVKMERENNMKEFRGMDEDMPKYGGGSEYNRDVREEVRRKKYGIVAKKYRPEAQPWILKLGGKNGKKFKGIREGGVSENAAFYVFTHAPDGNIEAYPLHEWYNFQPIQRYKTLSAEEAEHEFGRRKKVMNYFSLMLRKRLKGDDDEEQDPEDLQIKGGGKKAKGKELKISEMEEWINSDDDSESDEDDADGDKKKKKKDDSDDDGKSSKKSKKAADMKKKKKKKNASDSEAFEESDDGDDEGREMDYDTESSDEEADKDKELKSVAEEDALRKLLTSDEDDEDEEKKSDESGNEDDDKKKKKKDKNKDDKEKKKKTTKSQDDMKISSSDFSSDSSDSEDDVDAATTSNNKNNKNMKVFSTNSSRSGTPTSFMQSEMAAKRKMTNMPSDLTASENSNSPNNTPAKRTKIEGVPSTFSGAVNHNNKEDGITEEAVRRYLLRKPMTATELLTKFKSKKVNCTSERLVDTMTQILKKINPIKQTIQGKLYLSLKHTQSN